MRIPKPSGALAWVAVLGVVGGVAVAVVSGAGAAAAPDARPAYTCPMYDFASDQPGRCPHCGMTLVLASSVPPPPARDERPVQVAAYVCSKGDGTEGVAPGRCRTCGAEMVSAARDLSVALLIFPGVQIIDYTGPFEVFGQGRCTAFTVAKTKDAVTTSMGMQVVPKYSFADCPHADVLVIPGGGVDTVENDPEAIGWLTAKAGDARFVLSVCNGAFILARTGLLDGLTATTFYDLLDEFALRFPKVHAVSDRRYVDNGKFITTAGLSSGIDGSLHVIAKLRGQATAQRAALNMEYDWKPTADYARASFADRPLRAIFERNLRLRILDGVYPRVAYTQGDRNRWEVEWEVLSPLPGKELLARLDRTVAERGRWTRANAAAGSSGREAKGGLRSGWRFDQGGVPWQAVTEILPGDGANRHRVRVRVAKT
jgi:putative intracellular protease/amidase